jgi:hypothetical protein
LFSKVRVSVHIDVSSGEKRAHTLSIPAIIFCACLPHAINTTPFSGFSAVSEDGDVERGWREVIVRKIADVNDSQPLLACDPALFYQDYLKRGQTREREGEEGRTHFVCPYC